MMQSRLRHVGIVVENLERMKRFYQELGFSVDDRAVQHEQWGDRHIDVVKLLDPDGGCGIELISGRWDSHISLNVHKLPNHGVGPWKYADDVAVVFIQDPEGNWIEFVKELT